MRTNIQNIIQGYDRFHYHLLMEENKENFQSARNLPMNLKKSNQLADNYSDGYYPACTSYRLVLYIKSTGGLNQEEMRVFNNLKAQVFFADKGYFLG